jgi:hypothetical protein
VRGANGGNRVACGIGGDDRVVCGAVEDDRATHGAEEVVVSGGRGRGGTSTGSTSRGELRSRGGEEPARGKASSSKKHVERR